MFRPDKRGRFLVGWTPKRELQNKYFIRNGRKYPGNEHIGSFGCDSYDISGVVGGGGSNGSLHGMTKFNMDDAPSNEFFLEYIECQYYVKTINLVYYIILKTEGTEVLV